MATPIDQNFLARLKALNEEFAAGVPATVARLRSQRKLFDPRAPNAGALKEIHEILHTIAGSAATFGFRTFGQQARNLEHSLRVLKVFEHTGLADWDRWLDALDQFIAWAELDARASLYQARVLS